MFSLKLCIKLGNRLSLQKI